MPEFSEGKFVYSFPEGWEAIKWDETAFHRKTFQSFGGSAKAIDFVVFDPDGDALWLIECKDFRPDGRKKTIDLCDEMAEKFKAPQQAFIDGCDSYNSLIVFLTQEATLKKLSGGQIATVNQVRQIVYPICSSPMPANPTQATSEVLSGVSKLGAIKNSIPNPVTPTGK